MTAAIDGSPGVILRSVNFTIGSLWSN